jgi:hypothetical protein
LRPATAAAHLCCIKKFFSMRSIFLFTALTINFLAGNAQNISTPERGTPERKAILDALRPSVEADLGQKVEFVPSIFNVGGDWAFLYGAVQQPGGQPLDLQKLKHPGLAANRDEEMWENNFQALLRRENGAWMLVEQALSCTDVCWLDWAERKDLPKGLIPN